MTDSHLRELERRFRASGSVEDEAAWLRARVQAGELEQSKLELAAYLWDRGSRIAVGQAQAHSEPDPQEREGFGHWAESMPVSEKEVAVRGVLAVVEELQTRLGWPMQEPWPRYLEWLADPASAAQEARRELLEDEALAEPEEDWTSIRGLGDGLQKLLALQDQAAVRTVFRRVLVEVDTNLVWGQGSDAATPIGALRQDLIPWALGYSDPVRERVEAREAACE